VSLDRVHIRSCPFLLESDVLSLSPQFTLKSLQLQDSVVDVVHLIKEPGDRLLGLLSQTTTYSALINTAKQYQVSDTALRDLLGFLNRIGALQRARLWQGRVTATYKCCLHLMLGVIYSPLAYRKAATIPAVSLGILRATTPVFLAAGVVVGFSLVAGLVPARTVAITTLYWLSLFYTSVLLHELAHIRVLRQHNLSADILQANLRLGIIHAKPAPQIEIASSLSGPLVGASFCIIAAGLAWQTGAILLSLSSCVICVCHAFSLFPFYGDGMSLQKALQERKHTS
jgi:hypothetical protein